VPSDASRCRETKAPVFAGIPAAFPADRQVFVEVDAKVVASAATAGVANQRWGHRNRFRELSPSEVRVEARSSRLQRAGRQSSSRDPQEGEFCSPRPTRTSLASTRASPRSRIGWGLGTSGEETGRVSRSAGHCFRARQRARCWASTNSINCPSSGVGRRSSWGGCPGHHRSRRAPPLAVEPPTSHGVRERSFERSTCAAQGARATSGLQARPDGALAYATPGGGLGRRSGARSGGDSVPRSFRRACGGGVLAKGELVLS
jgi:hypothetical protein